MLVCGLDCCLDGADVDGERCERKVVSGSKSVVQLGGPKSAVRVAHVNLKHLGGKAARAKHARTYDQTV